MDQSTLFTWTTLGSMSGATLLTFMVVQYTKKIVDWFAAMPYVGVVLQWFNTDLYAWMIASVILFLASWATGTLIFPFYPFDVALCIANGLLVAMAAGQMFNKVSSPPLSPFEKKQLIK